MLRHKKAKTASVCIVLIWLMSAWGCAGRAYLIVDYQVPAASQALQGKAVQLRIEDQRGKPNVMSPAAAYQFRDFRQRYSLAWVTPGKERILAGEHDLMALVKLAFEKRLSQLGLSIEGATASQPPVLTVALQEFTIDLQGRKWTATIDYEASLTQKDHPKAKERIRGNAERVRVIGRKGADMVVSDIFTEAVNRVNIEKLFQEAKIIP